MGEGGNGRKGGRDGSKGQEVRARGFVLNMLFIESIPLEVVPTGWGFYDCTIIRGNIKIYKELSNPPLPRSRSLQEK